MFTRMIQLCSAFLLAFALAASSSVATMAGNDGIVRVKSAYTDFDWIARRHGIKNRGDQFKMASAVIGSITSSVKAK